MDPSRLKFDLVIFDCDGVLVDSELLSCQCLSEVLAEFGIALSQEQALELFLGRSTSAIEQHYSDLGQAVPDGFLPRLKSHFLTTFAGSLHPIPAIAPRYRKCVYRLAWLRPATS